MSDILVLHICINGRLYLSSIRPLSPRQAPNLYDISGSAHFINKCDNGIVIHRNRDKDAPLEERRKVEILVRKVRNKAAGTLGEATLLYDFVTGRYEDPGLEFNAPPPPPGG